MALTKLDNLYRQVILDHSSHPHHRGTLDDSTYKVELNNPTCGDVIHLELAVEGDTIKDIAFTGEGCSISTASASMMGDAIIGKTLAEAGELSGLFSELVQGNDIPQSDRLGDASMLGGGEVSCTHQVCDFSLESIRKSHCCRQYTSICQSQPRQ